MRNLEKYTQPADKHWLPILASGIAVSFVLTAVAYTVFVFTV